MKKIISLFFLVFIMSFYGSIAQTKVIVKLSKSQIENMTTSRIGDKVTVNFAHSGLSKLFKKFQFSSFYQSFPNALLFKHPLSERIAEYYTMEGNFEADRLVTEFRNSNFFELVEKIETPIPLYDPNDFALQDPNGGQWALINIKAKQAWDISQGSSSVKIAIIDFGFQTHEDLVNQIVYQDANMPVNEHGNTVSGCVACETDNGLGLSSIGFNSKLMS